MLEAPAILHEDGRPDRGQERRAGRASREGRMEQGLVYVEYISRLPGVPLAEFQRVLIQAQQSWASGHGEDRLLLSAGRTWRLGPEPEYLHVWHSPARPAAPGRLGRHLPRRGGRAPRPDGGARLAHRPRRLLPRLIPPRGQRGPLLRRAVPAHRERGGHPSPVPGAGPGPPGAAPEPAGHPPWRPRARSRWAGRLGPAGLRRPERIARRSWTACASRCALVSAATYADTGREILGSPAPCRTGEADREPAGAPPAGAGHDPGYTPPG